MPLHIHHKTIYTPGINHPHKGPAMVVNTRASILNSAKNETAPLQPEQLNLPLCQEDAPDHVTVNTIVLFLKNNEPRLAIDYKLNGDEKYKELPMERPVTREAIIDVLKGL